MSYHWDYFEVKLGINFASLEASYATQIHFGEYTDSWNNKNDDIKLEKWNPKKNVRKNNFKEE